MTLPIPSTMIAYGLSAIEPALNPTPNQTSAGPSQQKNYEIGKLWQSSTSGKGSPLMVMIADSVLCSIFNPTWPRETAPARATWDMSRVQKSRLTKNLSKMKSKHLAAFFVVALFQEWKPLWQFHKPPMCGHRWRSLERILLGRLLCLVRSCNRGVGWSCSLERRLLPGDHCGKYSFQTRQPIAVYDISIYICLIDIRSKSRTTEWEASRLVKGFPNYRISTNSSSRWQKIVFFFSSVVKSQLESTPKNSQEQSIWVQNIGLTFAPAASMLLTHSSRFSIIAEQLNVIKEVMIII